MSSLVSKGLSGHASPEKRDSEGQPTIKNPRLAPNFALRDQDGQTVELSRLRGKAVLLTFLYTHCPDACPLTAVRLNRALAALGPERTRVRVLAVSVDPHGDTRQAVAGFISSICSSNFATSPAHAPRSPPLGASTASPHTQPAATRRSTTPCTRFSSTRWAEAASSTTPPQPAPSSTTTSD
jgi:hypothetical protein